jgi:hypothetical protein
LAEYHLWEALANSTVVIDLGKTQILERQHAQPGHSIVNAKPPVFKVAQQGAKACLLDKSPPWLCA